MSKVTGRTDRFSLINTQGNRTIVSYGREQVDEVNSTWHEVSFAKDHSEKPSIELIKRAVIADINAETDARILSGYEWQGVSVWLSEENQRNFAEAQRIAVMMPEAILPVTFKLGEDSEGRPVYHEFKTAEELTGFYLSAVAYINQCLAEGWRRKDGMDFADYEEALNVEG